MEKKERSLLSKKREEKRKSPRTLKFKDDVIKFLDGKDPEIIYAIKRDLACMTSMPFYNDRPKPIKISLSPTQLLIKYMEIFINHEDKDFVITLIKALNKNQAQTIRKVAPKIGKKSEVWEHAIPANYIVDELIKMIEKRDISNLEKLLDIYEFAGQRGITKVEDLLLSEYKSSMPENWDWKDKNVNPLFRHEFVGIKH